MSVWLIPRRYPCGVVNRLIPLSLLLLLGSFLCLRCVVVVVGAPAPVVIPSSTAWLGNTPNPDGTMYLSHDFVTDVQGYGLGSGATPFLAQKLFAIHHIRQSGILGSHRINLEISDDQGNPLLGRNMINFYNRATSNGSGYGDVVGVAGASGDITTSLAVTSGQLQLAHSSMSGGFDFLNRQIYPLHLSSGISNARIADAMVALAARYGWKHFSLVASLDNFGRAFRDYIVNTYSSSFSIDQQTFSVFSSTDTANTLDIAMNNILANDNRIIIITASSTSTVAANIYNALNRAGILHDPRYVVIGQNWVINVPAAVMVGSSTLNVIGVIPPAPPQDVISQWVPLFRQTLVAMNMTTAQQTVSMNFFYNTISYVETVYNTFFTMMSAATRLWNTSQPVTGQNVFNTMSTVDTTTWGTRIRYDKTGFALYDVAITSYNVSLKGFSDVRYLYQGVTPIVNSSTGAASQFRTINDLMFIDETTAPPPDKPEYSLHLIPSSSSSTYTNQTHATLRDPNNQTYNLTMESGTTLPNHGIMVVITDQTGAIIPRQTIAIWTQALNGNPTINAYVTSSATSFNTNATGTSAISGTPSVKISSTANLAIADFSALIVSARPGTTVYVHFECILPGGYPLQSPIITIRMNDCPSGSYIDSKANVCRPCEGGYETRDTINAVTCVAILHEISPAVTVAFIVLASIGIAIATLVFGYVVVLTRRASRTIYHYSPTFCMITLIGMALVFASVIGMVINPVSSCTAQSVATWVFNIGFTWTFGAMFAKSYRLYKIFSNILLCMTAITNRQLYTMLGALTAVDVILLAVWQGVDPYTLDVGSYRTCNSGTVGSAIKYTLIAIKASLLLCGMYLTHATRRVPAAFNEHKASTIAIYNASVIGVVIVVIWFGMKSSSGDVTISLVQASGAWIGAFSTLCVIFGHLLYDVCLQSVSSAGSVGKKNTAMNVFNAASRAGPVFESHHSATHYSMLEAMAAEIQSRAASHHGDTEFLTTYAKLQTVMKTLSTNTHKKNTLLQQLAQICADKDYRRRNGQESTLHPHQQQQTQALTLAQTPGPSIELNNVKDEAGDHVRKSSVSNSITPKQNLLGNNHNNAQDQRRSSYIGAGVGGSVGVGVGGDPCGSFNHMHDSIPEHTPHQLEIGSGASNSLPLPNNNNVI